MSQSTTNWKNIVLLFIPGTLWGVSFLLNEIILETIPPFTLTAGRNLITIAAMLGILYTLGGKLARSWQIWQPYFVLGFANNALPFVLISWGQLYIDSGLATILISTMPLFTIILAHFSIADERLTRDKLIGIILGLAGIVVLIGPGVLAGLGLNIWGQFAVLGASVSYAWGAIYSRLYFKKRDAPSGSRWTSLVELTTGQFIASTLLVLPFSLSIEQPWRLNPSMASLNALVVTALVVTIVAVVVYYYLIDEAGATFASTVLYLIPINGVFWGAVILHERVTWQAILALFLILAGIAIINGLVRQRRPAGA